MSTTSTDNDLQLLARYTRGRAEDAFAEIVRRHLNLVYSAALRQVLSPQLAEEVAQSVFTDLASNAARLKPNTILTAWLYQVTRRTAVDVVRRESRRHLREQIATEMNTMNATADNWTHIEPLLDDAMDALEETDRTAVLLRYFENKSLREVGQALGTSDDTAQKRVSRAVDRLREFFDKRGITIGASGLASLVSVNAVQAVPAGLAVTISTAAALTGTTVVTTATATTTKAVAMTTLQKTLVTATIAVLAGAGLYEARKASQLRYQVQTLHQQQMPLADRLKQLETEREESARQIASLRDDNERLNRNTPELLRLRGEVTRFRANAQERAALNSSRTEVKPESETESWLRRIKLLKQRVEQTAEAKIPELQFLEEDDWMQAARNKLDTDEDWHNAFSDVRSRAQARFLDEAGLALRKYLATNSNQFPTEVLQLKPFFEKPPADDVFLRYQVVPANSNPLATPSEEGWVITPKFPEKGEFMALGQDSGFRAVDSPEMRILAPAMQAMMEATPVINGKRSADIHQLGHYLKTPEEKAAYERLMGKSK